MKRLNRLLTQEEILNAYDSTGCYSPDQSPGWCKAVGCSLCSRLVAQDTKTVNAVIEEIEDNLFENDDKLAYLEISRSKWAALKNKYGA